MSSSSTSDLLSRGTKTFVMPAVLLARSFSLRPPIGSTLPLNVSSQVIAPNEITGIPLTADNNAVAIVMPAEGPSFGVAPSGI